MKFCVAVLMGSVLVTLVVGECSDSQNACIEWAAAGYCDEGSVYRVCIQLFVQVCFTFCIILFYFLYNFVR